MFQTPRPSPSKRPIPAMSGMDGMPGILGPAPVPSPHLLRTPRNPLYPRDPFSMMHTDPGKCTCMQMTFRCVKDHVLFTCLNLGKILLL